MQQKQTLISNIKILQHKWTQKTSQAWLPFMTFGLKMERFLHPAAQIGHKYLNFSDYHSRYFKVKVAKFFRDCKHAFRKWNPKKQLARLTPGRKDCIHGTRNKQKKTSIRYTNEKLKANIQKVVYRSWIWTHRHCTVQRYQRRDQKHILCWVKVKAHQHSICTWRRQAGTLHLHTSTWQGLARGQRVHGQGRWTSTSRSKPVTIKYKVKAKVVSLRCHGRGQHNINWCHSNYSHSNGVIKVVQKR